MISRWRFALYAVLSLGYVAKVVWELKGALGR